MGADGITIPNEPPLQLGGVRCNQGKACGVTAQVDAWATLRDDGSWLIDGAMPVGEFKSRLGIDALPDEDRGRYNTVAGLLMAVSGRLPVTGEKIECAGWRFEVVDLDGRRIDKVLASQTAPPQR